MSLFNTSSGQSANLYGQSASPSLLWTFNGTFIESITGINAAGGTLGVNPFAAGLYGQALYMQTAASYQQYLYTLSSSLSTTNGFTASAWINSAGDTGSGIGIYGPSISGLLYLVEWGTQSGGYPYVNYYDPNNGTVAFRNLQSPTILPYNNWYNIGFVLGGSTNKTLTLYVNGVQKGSTTYGEDIAYDALNIFKAGSNYYIQDLSVYTSALTAAQMNSIYNQSAVPVTSISLTGTPLFSQISSAARSSAVGAFSLRAVNGRTALAVNVVPGGTFPPSLMTPAGGTNLSTQTLGTGVFQGSYTASSSNNAFGWGAPGAFSGTYINQPNLWQVNTYPTGGGTVSTPTTTTTASVNYNGDWLQLQTPFGINLTGYSVGTGFLTQVVLLGSTTGGTSSWTLIDSQTITDGQTITRTGLSTSAFTYFRFVIITSTTQYPLLGAVQFTGYAPSLAQDFYADRLGNLLTAPVTGQTLSSWLGGATGYVATWYDQSGQGNHASQATFANQPIIQRATKGPGYACLFNGTTNFLTGMSYTVLNNTNFSFNVVERRTGSTSGGTASSDVTLLSCGNVGSAGKLLYLLYRNNTTSIFGSYSPELYSTLSTYNSSTEPIRYTSATASSTSGRRIYIYNDPLGNPITTTNATQTSLMSMTSGNFQIGYYTYGSSTSYYTGEIYEILVFTQSLYDLDTSGGLITNIYQNQLGAYGT